MHRQIRLFVFRGVCQTFHPILVLLAPVLWLRGEFLDEGAGAGKREDDLLVVVDVLVRDSSSIA